MEFYLVGGAVRDQLLGLPVRERDWVVIGATPQEMLALGFIQVGNDFPVFLHPKTHEEYALARTERKTGKGYLGFDCFYDPSVTLEEDLKRRDLTINAIAKNSSGEIIDLYNGRHDLERKILRHVSLAFREDPVRVLRVARFAARFEDFEVHPETLQLMQSMAAETDELKVLAPDRVWKEFVRALDEIAPYRFFDVLHQARAIEKIFPEMASALECVMVNLNDAVQKDFSSIERFAALGMCLDLENLELFMKRLPVPKKHQDLARLALVNKAVVGRAYRLNAVEILDFFEKTDAFRRPERFAQVLRVCAINSGKDRAEFLYKIQQKAIEVELLAAIMDKLSGAKIASKLHTARLEKIEQTLCEVLIKKS